MNDVGQNAPEDVATLLHQQNELMSGDRSVQMFPAGTYEIPMLVGTARYVNERGIFHYWPNKITEEVIELLSSQGKENLLLRLGPYSKVDIAKRLEKGEKLVFITEYSPGGVEIRSAAGTDQTCAEQLAYFEHTKGVGNNIVVGAPPERVQRVLRKAN
jgi:hypothetical protein